MNPPLVGSGPRSSGVKMTVTHEWLRLDLGNNRGLTTSYGGTKSTGAVPNAVFKAWCEAVDGKGVWASKGKNVGERVASFADEMDSIWPDWKKAPDTSHLVVGYRGSMFLGPRKGSKGYVITDLPTRKGGSYKIQMDGASCKTLVAADMLRPAPAPAAPAAPAPAAPAAPASAPARVPPTLAQLMRGEVGS